MACSCSTGGYALPEVAGLLGRPGRRMSGGPEGFGRIHWDTLSPEARARALELWVQLLREVSEAEGEA